MKKKYKPWLRAFSAVSGNLSAAWFGVAFISPNFTDISKIEGVIFLTWNIVLGILFLLITVYFERKLQ